MLPRTAGFPRTPSPGSKARRRECESRPGRRAALPLCDRGLDSARSRRRALEHTDTIKAILNQYRREPLAEDWLPLAGFDSETGHDELSFSWDGEWGVTVTATPSGLKYKIVRAGEGKKPAGPMSSVTVHYCGWLADNGKQFDASYDRGQPISFGLSQVIPGWTEGMQLIGEGGAVILVIPSDLGYGDRGSPPTIPGGATLVFYVETLGVQD